ncbi:MAG: phosphotriesterase [Bacteroidota bacterium]
MINRRRFISLSSMAAAYGLLPIRLNVAYVGSGFIMTVTGKIKLTEAGSFLSHEHTLTDFTGAEKIAQPQYDRDKAFEFLLPYLKKLKAGGVDTLAECSPAYIGRDALLVKRLSEASGIHILTNTGYYAAVDFKYLPAHAHTESSDQLSARWLKEWNEGISDTGIRPGFIKLGVGSAPLKPLEKKLIEAAAKTHLQSGLKIAIHTGDGAAAAEELAFLEASGLSPEAMIWVHAQNDQSGIHHLALAEKGCWISLDGFNGSPGTPEQYKKHLLAFKKAGLLHKVLLSHDDGFAVVNSGEAIYFEQFKNGNNEPYLTIDKLLMPLLKEVGFTPKELRLLRHTNPATAFSIQIHSRKK